MPGSRRLSAIFSMIACCAMLAAACAGGGARSLPADGELLHINAELEVRRIAPDAFVVTHEPAYSSNVLLARMPDGSILLCSSPLDTEATRSMLVWIRQAFAPPRIVAINPHYHPDGTAGNDAYAEAGVETYATALTQRLLVEHGARVRDASAASLDNPSLAERVRGTRIVPAAHTIDRDEPFILTLGGEEVRVIHPGAAHAPDNVVILFPARGILFGGCMIKAGRSIGYTGDADLRNWEAAVMSLEDLGARIVIPGHGAVGGPELLANTIEVVREALP